jgi:hypothetical protein
LPVIKQQKKYENQKFVIIRICIATLLLCTLPSFAPGETTACLQLPGRQCLTDGQNRPLKTMRCSFRGKIASSMRRSAFSIAGTELGSQRSPTKPKSRTRRGSDHEDVVADEEARGSLEERGRMLKPQQLGPLSAEETVGARRTSRRWRGSAAVANASAFRPSPHPS